MMARSTMRSKQRPDTLMQDHSYRIDENIFATHGRTIHWGQCHGTKTSERQKPRGVCCVAQTR
jgi:hypothetical protein